MSSAATTGPGSLPLVVHSGFAGSRQLLSPDSADAARHAAFEEEVAGLLETRLRSLVSELELGSRHLVCGVSQVAIGADLVFSQVVARLGWAQRVFLPQPRDVFLAATGSNGEPDFPGKSREAAAGVLDSPHVVQERVVSKAPTRTARFLDANVAIARVCDVAVCLVRSDAAAKAAGTQDFMGRALARGKPVLEVRVGVDAQEKPVFEEAWHGRDRWKAPKVLDDLSDVPWPPPGGPGPGTPAPPAPAGGELRLPSSKDYAEHLKSFCSKQAKRHQGFFKRAAVLILGTHLAATLVSLLALAGHGMEEWGWLALLVGVELALLAGGWAVHVLLHRAHGARTWAVSRLVAEIARSVLAMRGAHVQLDYLFTLPLPTGLRSLLKTLNVLHLNETRHGLTESWESRRSVYLSSRLTDPKSGQVTYYAREGVKAQLRAAWMGYLFLAFSALAVLTSLIEFVLLLSTGEAPTPLGVMAVMFPLFAVAALTVSSSLDYEARGHVYAEMVEFLGHQTAYLCAAGSEGEFAELALATEAHLLGETANWFARRSFLGVA